MGDRCSHCNGTGFLSSHTVEYVTYPSGVKIYKALLSKEEAPIYGTTGIYTAAPLLLVNGSEKLGDHLFALEFMPKDSRYKYLRCAPELVRRIEKIQKAFNGMKVTITSSYRPPEYNRIQGGVSNSAHIDGLAADITIPGVSTESLQKVCDIIIGNDGGVGYYQSQGFCHIDIRGYKTRWDG